MKLFLEKNIKFKEFGQPIRLALTGTKFAPSINEIIKSLGVNEIKFRLAAAFYKKNRLFATKLIVKL